VGAAHPGGGVGNGGQQGLGGGVATFMVAWDQGLHTG
jgi:hypothetical protein